MKQQEIMRIEQRLRDRPEGILTTEFQPCPGSEAQRPARLFSARIRGRGLAEVYPLFPGMEGAFVTLLGSQAEFSHEASPAVLEIFYCRTGRVGWNMRGGTSVYLGAGDAVLHSAARCADSAMVFPLGYAEGVSVSVDLSRSASDLPEPLRLAGVDPRSLQARFCAADPVILSAGVETDRIFAPLFAARPDLRGPYLQIKVQELLLYLSEFRPGRQEKAQYASGQTEQIRQIHQLLTGDLSRRFTIEELSRRYLINTSTLKEVFKAVYGQPIATYMKEYRIHQAMKLLQETDDSIAKIAARVGYETQGKFSQAFKDVARVLPTEYRKAYWQKN